MSTQASQTDKTAFFDDLSNRWDSKLDLTALHARLVHELQQFAIQPHEHVIDVGCGTGNMTQALLALLGTSGRITAVDVSAAMIARAQNKISDSRVSWHVGDALHLPNQDSSVDRVMYFQVWPHFDDTKAVAQKCWRVLKPGGCLHIWHIDSRERINQIHAGISNPAVASDWLDPASETAQVLQDAGLISNHVSESEKHYLVSAYKP